MGHDTLDEKVKANEEVYDFIFVFLEIVEALSERGHLKNLLRQQVHLLRLKQRE